MKLFTFKEYKDDYPCEECNAKCCKYLLIPYKTPSSWMDMDFIKYLLNFPKVKVAVSKNGNWELLIQGDCMNLDEQTNKCTVHNTDSQPRTCVYLNPYHCYYKVNLENKNPPGIYILDREKFEHWVKFIKFDENGTIVEAPSFEKSLKILKDLGN
jgi:hypothetical protein